MKSKSVLISLPEDLLKQVDEMAKKESRSRSEFFREAVRISIAKRLLAELVKSGRARAKRLGISEEDVPRLVKETREQMRRERPTANERRS